MRIGKTNKLQKLGHRIQKLRKERNWTQEELAEYLNISRTHMGHIEQGRKEVSLSLLSKIAKKLHTTASDLLPF